jgi:MFS family permease
VLWLSVAAYFLGLIVGVLASQVMDVQLRRPGLKLSLVLAMLGTLLTVFLINTNSTMPQWLLMCLWVGIGLLAGLGSRESRVAGF